MRHLLPAAALAVAAALPASAQQIRMISGFVDDTTVGPLTDDFVYHVQGSSIVVRAGHTLTIEDGVVIKFPQTSSFTVVGALDALGGTGGIVLTSLTDGTVGGGAGSGSPGDWSGVDIGTSDSSVNMRGVEIRYAGGLQGTAVLIRNEAGTFEDCTVRDSAGDGWDLGGQAVATLTRCAAHDCAGTAFAHCTWETLTRFTDPTATGNAGGNWVEVNWQTPHGGTFAIDERMGVGGVIHPNGNLRVNPTSTLELYNGVIVKLQPGGLVEAFGRLDTYGAGNLFTSEFDDQAGGDSNGDGGATQAAPGDWYGVRYWSNSSASRVNRLTMRYGGAASGAALSIFGSDALFSGITVEDSAGDGIRMSDDARPSLQSPVIRRNGGKAIATCAIQALAGIRTPTVSGNGKDQLRVTDCVMHPGDVVELDGSVGPLGTIVLAEPLSVAAGAELRLADDVIIKNAPGVHWSVAGKLEVEGEPFRRTMITSESDDSVGGDSDGGISVGWPGDWRGIDLLASSDGSALSYAELRYGGAGFPAIRMHSCEVEIVSCVIDSFAGVGVDANGNAEPCTVGSNLIRGCGGEAIGGVAVDALPDYRGNRATGNGADRLRAVGFDLTESIAIDRFSGIEGVVHLQHGIRVPEGVSLDLYRGVVLKMDQGTRISVLGTLYVGGTEGDPVIVTDVRDDVGGDTNGGGFSPLPAPGWWRGIEFLDTPTGISSVNGLEVYYGGGGASPQVWVRTPSVGLVDVGSYESLIDGFRFEGEVGRAERLTAGFNDGDGFEFTGGPFDVRQLTAAFNLGCGVRAGANANGFVRDSVASDNFGGDWCGWVAGQLDHCNGDPNLAGANGNIDVEPGFTDPANGDFSLLPNSLMIDAGSPASPLDPDGTRADIGGSPFNACEPSMYCEQPPGPGCPVTLHLDGFASASSSDPFLVRLEGAPTQQFGLFFYGTGAAAQTTTPFGDLCIAGSLVRMPVISAGGSLGFGGCEGAFEVDLNDWIQSGIDPSLVAGITVRGQFWYRDIASTAGALFSPAVEATICP